MNVAAFERTPLEVAPTLVEVLNGRTLVDLGCGDGALVKAIRDAGGSSRGIESDIRWQPTWDRDELGVEVADFLSVPLPKEVVLFAFLSFVGTWNLTVKIKKEEWHGTVITHYYPLHFFPGIYMRPKNMLVVPLPDGGSVPLLVYDL